MHYNRKKAVLFFFPASCYHVIQEGGGRDKHISGYSGLEKYMEKNGIRDLKEIRGIVS